MTVAEAHHTMRVAIVAKTPPISGNGVEVGGATGTRHAEPFAWAAGR